jgi:TPR repeat protein
MNMAFRSLFVCAIVLATIKLLADKEESLFDLPTTRVAEYKELATKGDSKAQHKLAMLYFIGLSGVEKDEAKGLALLEASAQAGYIDSQIALGSFHESREKSASKVEDLTLTAKWYRKAADQGSEAGCFRLGYCYLEGVGVNQSETEALAWWAKAGVPDLDAKKLVELHKRIVAGEWQANKELATISTKDPYWNWGAKTPLEASARYYSSLFSHNLKLAKDGDTKAMVKVANVYRSPSFRGEPDKDRKQSLEWLQKAVSLGEKTAFVELGKYFDDEPGASSKKTAYGYFSKAAEDGDTYAMIRIARMLEDGELGRPDAAESTRWMLKAAECGDESAWFYIGHRYQNGKGIPQDFVKAYAWFSISATDEKEGSDSAARNRLKILSAQMTRNQISDAQKLAADLWSDLERRRQGK